MFIKDCSNQQIGEVLTKVCELSDLDAPKQPKMIIEFIRKYYGKYELTIIDRAIEQWVLGSIPIKKPDALNAQFISNIMFRALKDDLVGRVNVYRTPKMESPVNVPPLTKEKKHKGYELQMKDWINYEQTGMIKSLLVFYEIQYKYIYQNIDKMEYTQEQRDLMTEEIKDAYVLTEKAQRQEQLSRGINLRKYIGQRDLNSYNWNRISSVALHYRDRYNAKK